MNYQRKPSLAAVGHCINCGRRCFYVRWEWLSATGHPYCDRKTVWLKFRPRRQHYVSRYSNGSV